MTSSDEIQSKSLLHIVVIGFHHKKGCQVEFSYPPLIPGTDETSGAVPLEWKHLPTLALPDGAHNYSKDTIYFHLKNKKGPCKATVYGVSCYRQIDAKDIVNKTDDITRGTVQKSVCVLTTTPCFGAVAAKLELVTHAWFEQRDFTQLDLLKDAFGSLSVSLGSLTIESQATMGLHLHEVVKLYRHKILVLFKLILLERKTVFFMTPVSDLCNVILSILSLFPGLLELGLIESVENTKTPVVTPTIVTNQVDNKADEPFADIHCNVENDLKGKGEVDTIPHLTRPECRDSDSQVIARQPLNSVNNWNMETVGSPSGDTEKPVFPDPEKPVFPDQSLKLGSLEKELHPISGESDLDILELDSADSLHQIDLEDQESFIWDTSRPHTLALADDQNAGVGISPGEEGEQYSFASDGLTDGLTDRKRLTIDTSGVKLEVVPIVSPTSILINKAGLPLAIFTKGSVCHPYLSLSYYDILEDVNIRSFIIGASNVLFKQKRQNIDVLVERSSNVKKDDPGGILILDKELQKHLQLTTEDLRFAHMINSRVEETAASGEFLEGTEWEGGDEWIRAQFKDYLQSLMASVLAEDTHLLEAFNINFVNAWKSTHNYKVWRNTVQQLEDVIPGHPCQGGVTLNDVKLQLARSDRGRKINAVVDQAGKAVTDTSKAVGGALSNAKTLVSSWWSNISNSSHQSENTGG